MDEHFHYLRKQTSSGASTQKNMAEGIYFPKTREGEFLFSENANNLGGRVLIALLSPLVGTQVT